jgi:hypothetical protein
MKNHGTDPVPVSGRDQEQFQEQFTNCFEAVSRAVSELFLILIQYRFQEGFRTGFRRVILKASFSLDSRVSQREESLDFQCDGQMLIRVGMGDFLSERTRVMKGGWRENRPPWGVTK